MQKAKYRKSIKSKNQYEEFINSVKTLGTIFRYSDLKSDLVRSSARFHLSRIDKLNENYGWIDNLTPNSQKLIDTIRMILNEKIR